MASPYISWPFFVSLVLLGGYFAIDLLMGVLGNQYLRAKEVIQTMIIKRKMKSQRLKLGIGMSLNFVVVEYDEEKW